ncbi:T9SS type A sorting domain-containing protein, partial [Aequorivita capsosiphonis]|uniref:T9SS type A sorting domain-containing protein n=1 Tax=Aequorivita capsosiphonis TaxID=487317 RepID=UPI00047A5BA2
GTGGDCEQEHPIAGDGNGGSGSSVDSDFTSAADIVVAAGEDFTLDTIEVSFLTFAPEDAPITANVIYYEDAAGLPGAEIGTETVVPTILSSGEWVNPVAFRFDTSLDMTPFTFGGDAGSDTSYWIGIEMGTATNQATVFWLYTDGAGIEGEPMAQYNAVDGFWTVPEPTREVGYVFSGECSPLSVADNTLGGFTFYPNPTSGSLSLSSVSNIDSVAIYNLLGQKVMDVKVEATTSEINISGLNTGTYIMKVSVEGQIGTYKVLKN